VISALTKESADQKERTAKIEADNLQLRGQLITLERSTADAKTRQAEAESKLNATALDVEQAREEGRNTALALAKQQERAANAERELLELKERVAPRRLTAAQRTALLAALKAAAPKGRVDVVCSVGDGEARSFAIEILATLKDAGWPTLGSVSAEFVTGFGTLVVVKGPADAPAGTVFPDAPRHAVSLSRAFSAAGLEIGTNAAPHLKADEVKLVVATKPR
jgi:hypothetical protein